MSTTRVCIWTNPTIARGVNSPTSGAPGLRRPITDNGVEQHQAMLNHGHSTCQKPAITCNTASIQTSNVAHELVPDWRRPITDRRSGASQATSPSSSVPGLKRPINDERRVEAPSNVASLPLPIFLKLRRPHVESATTSTTISNQTSLST